MSVRIGIDIEEAAIQLASGRLVAIPTETVYGLAANAYNADAVLGIFEAKNRPQFNPLIVHTDRLEKVMPALGEIPRLAHKLAKRFWPGPLTLLLPRNEIIPDLVTAGNDRVAVRIPSHPMTLELLSQLDFPLAAPSANPFGYISPTTAEHVAAQLGQKVAYILDGGATTIGIESTIIGFEPNGKTRMYRSGGLPAEEIEQLTGPLLPPVTAENNPQTSGMLKSHYAPHTPLILGDIEALAPQYANRDMGLLTFKDTYPKVSARKVEVLSPAGDLREAAQRLFAALRRLDASGLQVILAEPVLDEGLGRAINDRLTRAEADRKG